MEIFANELSFVKESLLDYESVHVLALVSKELKSYGINTCRISNREFGRVIKAIIENDTNRNLADFVFSFFKALYEEHDMIESISDSYLSDNWTCKGIACEGLAFAYLTETLALSLDSRKWGEMVRINRNEEGVDVRNVSSTSHIEYHSEWLDSQRPVELAISYISPTQKDIHLRDDHGKDKLMSFSRKLVRSPYVESIVNSLPFNAENKSFIKKIRDDGIVECVLHWYDEGYGLAVKTTGRNKRETIAIAEILKREYGRGDRI